MLLLPLTAFASGFAGAAGAYRHTGAGTGGSTSLGEVGLFLGVVAAVVLIVFVASRIDIHRKTVGVGLKPRATA
jgi:hypothetical protein